MMPDFIIMSQLIQMSRRIKAIETTKKITQAMRLISISLHTRLKKLNNNFQFYEKKIEEISLIGFFSKFIDINSNKSLFIVIGSQKGLCGTFNNNLALFFNNIKIKPEDEIILIGKQVFSLIKIKKILEKINNFNSNNLDEIVDLILKIIEKNNSYNSVKIVFSISKSFFNQIPIIINLEPDNNNNNNNNIWWWPEPKDLLIEKISKIKIKTKIKSSLLHSLVAEQASRFRSMDNATTNAKKLLGEMKLKYNKSRQAKITKEITELSSNFQTQN